MPPAATCPALAAALRPAILSVNEAASESWVRRLADALGLCAVWHRGIALACCGPLELPLRRDRPPAAAAENGGAIAGIVSGDSGGSIGGGGGGGGGGIGGGGGGSSASVGGPIEEGDALLFHPGLVCEATARRRLTGAVLGRRLAFNLSDATQAVGAR